MAWHPDAIQFPYGTTPGGPITPRVAILHVDAVGAGPPKPHAGLEWHFWISYEGRLYQYVDTALRADANYKANGFAISIETEGKGEGLWTPAQVAAILELLAWLHQVHPTIPLVVCKEWHGSGVGYHTQFGAPGPWTPVAKSCPGPNRKTQFWTEIVPALSHLTPPTEAIDKMLYIIRADNSFDHFVTDRVWKTYLPADSLATEQFLASIHPAQYHDGGKTVVWPKAQVDAIPSAG